MNPILVIDDDAELYSLLAEYFAQADFISEHAADGETALAKLRADPGRWDAVILDLMLPGASGLDVLQEIRANESTRDLPVLILTAQGEESARIVGLEAGADDYLPKPFSLRELSARLKAILRRSGKRADDGASAAAETQRVDNLVVHRSAFRVEYDGKSADLTLMEMRLLCVLIEEPGRIVTREELYRRVFEHEMHNHDRSLDMAVSRLRKKLGPRSDGGERIRAAWGAGYVFLLPGAQA